MIELTDEIILKIDDLTVEFCIPALALGMAVHEKEEIPNKYANDDIFIEYYNGIKEGKTADQMRKVCFPKYVRRELNKNN